MGMGMTMRVSRGPRSLFESAGLITHFNYLHESFIDTWDLFVKVTALWRDALLHIASAVEVHD